MVPVPRSGLTEGDFCLQGLAELAADRFGGPLHGRFGDRQSAHLGQDHVGGLVEAVQGSSQASQLGRTGGQVASVQAEGVVAGAVAVMAVGAVGSRETSHGQGAEDREQPLFPVVFQLRRFLAVGAGHAGNPLAPFFRCKAAVWRAWGAEPMDEIAKLELGRTEELVVGFADLDLANGADVVFGGRLNRFIQLFSTLCLLFGKMGKKHETLREQRTTDSWATHQRPLFNEIFHPLSRHPVPLATGARDAANFFRYNPDSSRISTESWVPLVVPDQCVRPSSTGTGRVRPVAPEICPNCLAINSLL